MPPWDDSNCVSSMIWTALFFFFICCPFTQHSLQKQGPSTQNATTTLTLHSPGSSTCQAHHTHDAPSTQHSLHLLDPTIYLTLLYTPGSLHTQRPIHTLVVLPNAPSPLTPSMHQAHPHSKSVLHTRPLSTKTIHQLGFHSRTLHVLGLSILDLTPNSI